MDLLRRWSQRSPSKQHQQMAAWCLPQYGRGGLPWPANSPDLNPIDQMWSILKKGIGREGDTNPEELFRRAEEAWNAISIEQVDALVDSYRTRVLGVPALQGRWLNGLAMHTGQRKSRAPPPISAPMKHKQVNPILFMNILSTILNGPTKTARPVAEDALHVVKRGVISHLRNCHFDLATRRKLPILENSVQYPKEPTVRQGHVQRMRWVWHSEKMVLLEFRLDP
jgi:hypothetical protein